MKHNLPPAKLQSLPLALVILTAILSAPSCVTLPNPAQSAVRLNQQTSRADQVSVININTASRQELEKLPGVGAGIAERIVAHREQYGPFRRAEHLMMVRGISDRKFRELQAMIVVN